MSDSEERTDPLIALELTAEDITVRSATRRELDLRIVPWNRRIRTQTGMEEFERGAFDGIDPSAVRVFGSEHRVDLGLDQTGHVVPVRIPVGKGVGTEVDQREDAAYMTVRIAGTSAGDDVLALAADGIAAGVSVEFSEVPGGSAVERRDGQRVRVHRRVDLTAVSTTYRPAYQEAQVVAMRTGGPDMTEPMEAPPVQPVDYDKIADAIATGQTRSAEAQTLVVEKLLERLEKLEEQSRAAFTIPVLDEEKGPHSGDWMRVAIRLLTGERMADAEYRSVADFITTDNAGVVPPAYNTELIGIIEPLRPFLESTRRIPTPASGTSIIFPKITQRPTTAVQSTEKSELSSTKTVITTATFPAVTIGGYGDLSIQLLKRSSPEFLALYLELLAEAYSIDCDEQALRVLFDDIGGVGGASALDPEALVVGPAFEACMDVMKRPPDTIWLSTEAVAAFIDAKTGSGGGNAPLYSNITANFTAGNAPVGLISGLRPIHVPSLDTHGCFALIGPSRGFAWAEDGTYTLQVDVPAKAGRDVGIVGMIWPMDIYPDAFTAYNVAS